MAIVRVMHTYFYDYDFEVIALPPSWDTYSGEQRWRWTVINGKQIWKSPEPKRFVWAEVPAMSEWQLTGNPEALTKDPEK